VSRTRCLLALVAATAALFAVPGLARAAIVTNGDFETGNLSGWQSSNAGNGSWFAYTGTTTPLSVFTFPAPPQGNFGALSDETGEGTHLLYQDVTLPPGGTTNQLSLFVYYDSRDPIVSPDTLDYTGAPNQQYRIDVMKPSAPTDSVAPGDVLLTVFRTLSGDPQTLSPTTKTADLSAYAGQTVRLRLAEVDNQFYFNAAADAVSVKSNGFEIGKASVNKKNGTATVPVTVPDDGSLAATGKGVKVKVGASTAKSVSAGTVKLKVKPKGKTRSKLNASGKAKVKLKITYTPNGLSATTRKTKLKLKKS